MTYTEIIRLYESKENIIKRTNMTDEQKAEVIEFFKKHREQEQNISGDEWNKPSELTYERFKQVIDAFNNRKTKSKANKVANKQGIEGIIEGIDYIDLGEHIDAVLGTFHAYVPLSWLGAKTIEGKTVLPVGISKDSASWCIGWTSSDQYWEKYFSTEESSFLILCGENIPLKKVCFELLHIYDSFSSSDNKKQATQDEHSFMEAFVSDDIKVWDYNDNRHEFNDFLMWSNKKNEHTLEELYDTAVLLEKLFDKAKDASDDRREKLEEEANENLVILKSSYVDKLTTFRKKEEYKEFLNKGINFLTLMDKVAEALKKYDNSIMFNLCDSREPWSVVNSTYTESLLDWYNTNKDKHIAYDYFEDLDSIISYNDSFVTKVPSFIEPFGIINNDNYSTHKYRLFYDNGVYKDTVMNFNYVYLGRARGVQDCYGYKNFLLFRNYRYSDDASVRRNKRVILADFKESGILTVNDHIAFLGEYLSSRKSYILDFSIPFKNSEVLGVLEPLSYGRIPTDPERKVIIDTLPTYAKLFNINSDINTFVFQIYAPLKLIFDFDVTDRFCIARAFSEEFINKQPELLTSIDALVSKIYPLSKLEALP